MGFFDDLSKKANETRKNAAEKTSKFTREMKLKSQINDSKSKIEELYKEIGKRVYEKHVAGQNVDIKTDLIEECSKIDAYASEINDMRVEILSLKDLKLCSNCATEIALNAKFCPKCGTVQEESQPAQVIENNVEEVVNEVVEETAPEEE